MKVICRWTTTLLLLCTATRLAGAQDSLPSFERPNGSLLRAGSLSYILSVTKPTGEVVQLGSRTVSVTDSQLGGVPGWLIAESRTGTVVPTSDSVYLARADLAPDRWTATIGRASLGASFTRDSMYGGIESYRGRASFAAAVPPNALLSAGMVERIIEMLPLREGYRAAATLVLIDGAVPRFVPAEIAVDSRVRIAVGNRSVECWSVTLRAGPTEKRFWIARDGARVVRTEQGTPEGLLVSALLVR